jgi:hypothetical protein
LRVQGLGLLPGQEWLYEAYIKSALSRLGCESAADLH